MMEATAIVTILGFVLMVVLAVYYAARSEQYEDVIVNIRKENQHMEAELAEMTRLMEEQFALRADAMEAGKALLRDAIRSSQEE